MKQKLTLLILALVTSLGVWAKTALEYTALTTGVDYVLMDNGTSYFLSNGGKTNQLSSVNKYRIVASGTDGQYYLMQVSTNQYVATATSHMSSVTWTSDQASAEKFTINKQSSNTRVRFVSTTNSSLFLNSQGSSTTCPVWSTGTGDWSYWMVYTYEDAYGELPWASLVSDPRHPVYYTIKNYRSEKYATYTGASSTLSQVTPATYNSLWYFVENGTGVSIVPAADPTLKLASCSSATAAGAVWYLKENPYNAGYFCVSLNSDLSNNCWDDQGSHTSIGYYNPRSTDYEGTSWTIEKASNYVPEIPDGKFLSIGEKVNSFTVSASASDNNHWYIITQTRGGETPVYNVGTGSQLQRAGTGKTIATLNGTSASLSTEYLVRFISAGEGLYNIQFADGEFVDASLNSTAFQSSAGTYAFYNTESESTTFGWNLNNNTGSIVDNNGAGSTLSFWGSGTVTGDKKTANNVWAIYPVVFTDTPSLSYSFSTTYGAFFQDLTTNKAAGATTYCNLWLSKAEAGKPQLKLITNDATASGGNNIHSTGGLYAKTSAYQYNLSVSEGKIKSYTIVGTAVGALSITPAGGVDEAFAASDAVNKKVTLGSPAKSTSFTLTGSGDAQWLDVSQFIIEWETDGTIVTYLGDITNDGIYMMSPHNAERGVLYAGTTYLDACGGHANTYYPANKNVAIDASDANQQFVLYTYGGNTYLYNIGRAKFAGTADGLYYKLTNCPSNKWTVTDGAYSGYFHITSQVDSKMATLNAWVNTGSSDSKDYAITGTTANEEANNFMLNRVGSLTTEQQAAIESIIANYETLMSNLDKLQEYTIGTGVGEYTNADFTTEEYKETNIATIRTAAADYDASTLSSEKNTSTASISKMVLNSVPTNAFYRIKGYATNKYAKAGTITASNVDTAADPSSKIPNSVNQETDGSDIWYYDASNHLINYKNGLGTFATRAFASLDKTKETTTFQASTCTAAGAKKIGVYEVLSNYSGSKVWYSNDNNVDRNSANNDAKCEWVLETVTSLPVTISTAKWATLYSPVALTIHEDVQAFYISALTETTATLTEITTTIPAETPVILYADIDAATTFDFDIATSEDFEETNYLEGCDATFAVSEDDVTNKTYYTLQRNAADATIIGLYPKTVAGSIAGFKAYMLGEDIPVGVGVKGFSFIFEDDPDAIKTLSDSPLKGENIYNLAGQMVNGKSVNGKLPKGIYIVNGKKIMK